MIELIICLFCLYFIPGAIYIAHYWLDESDFTAEWMGWNFFCDEMLIIVLLILMWPYFAVDNN